MEITTVADACVVLDYLHRRELLCSLCGDHVALYENQFHRRCENCKSDKANYNKAKVPNELERRIIGALQRWVEGNPAGRVEEEPDPSR